MWRPRSTGPRKFFANVLKPETPMSNEQQRPDMRHLWQGQVIEGASMSLNELRNALAKRHRVERRRTLVGGLFCLLFLGAFGALLIMAAPIRIVRAFECF